MICFITALFPDYDAFPTYCIDCINSCVIFSLIINSKMTIILFYEESFYQFIYHRSSWIDIRNNR